ncbi:hypothetical protein RJ639_033601 [Escallonia herrerae]|uniref:RRM domain-containing protein n=1 Tax=Escallonia herrerae TaxID=1293975 RepID=A0AA88WV60_9ASTE|nr:hypothetical protein RJ639_033601 [Escallonia herrerae]
MERHRDYYGDYQEPHWNRQLATSSWPSGDHFPHYDRNFDNYVGGGFPENGNHHYHHHHEDGRHQHQYRRHHHHNNFGSGPNDSIGGGSDEAGPGQSLPFLGRKRPFPHSAHDTTPADTSITLNLPSKQHGLVRYCASMLPSHGGNAATTLWCHEKLVAIDAAGQRLTYVVVDNSMGFKQYLSTIKLSPVDDDDKPSCEMEWSVMCLTNMDTLLKSCLSRIKELDNNKNMLPIKVRYADKERERIGINASGVGNPQASSGVFGGHVHKLYVGCLNKQAAMKDIEEIFSPYGLVKDVYIVRDELKQSRGCAFVLFSQRDMAVAAISELNGKYFTGVCDHPLVVKFAEPRKPRDGEARWNGVMYIYYPQYISVIDILPYGTGALPSQLEHEAGLRLENWLPRRDGSLAAV